MNTAHTRESMLTKILGSSGISPSLGWASGPDSGRTGCLTASIPPAGSTSGVRGNAVRNQEGCTRQEEGIECLTY